MEDADGPHLHRLLLGGARVTHGIPEHKWGKRDVRLCEALCIVCGARGARSVCYAWARA